MLFFCFYFIVGFQEVALKQLSKIREGQKYIISLLEDIKGQGPRQTNTVDEADFSNLPDFPRNTTEDLRELNLHLTVEEHKQLLVFIKF